MNPRISEFCQRVRDGYFLVSSSPTIDHVFFVEISNGEDHLTYGFHTRSITPEENEALLACAIDQLLTLTRK